MHAIDSWFRNGCPYLQGVELYKQYGSNAGLKTILGFGPNQYNRARLKEAMASLMESVPPTTVPKQITEKDHDEIQHLYRERASMHAQLEHIPSTTDRAKVAFRILAITDRIEKILGVKKDDTTGLPARPAPTAKALPTDPIKLLRQRDNNRAYISKNKEKANKQGEVQRRLAENEEIEKLINPQ